MTKGQRIRLRRENLGIGQSELASKIHVSKQTLYKYENDIVTNIPSDKIEELSRALDCTPAYLMGWDEPVDFVAESNKKESAIPISDDERTLIEMYRHTDNETRSMIDRLLKYSKLYQSDGPSHTAGKAARRMSIEPDKILTRRKEKK